MLCFVLFKKRMLPFPQETGTLIESYEKKYNKFFIFAYASKGR
jgi:hypothetical protein